METTFSSKADLANNDAQVWHTGVALSGGLPSPRGAGGGGAAEKGWCKKRRVILVTWDRSRGIIFAGFSVAFVIWALVFFPLFLK